MSPASAVIIFAEGAKAEDLLINPIFLYYYTDEPSPVPN